jgi:hypothetical protein
VGVYYSYARARDETGPVSKIGELRHALSRVVPSMTFLEGSLERYQTGRSKENTPSSHVILGALYDLRDRSRFVPASVVEVWPVVRP